jgi:hypothetical protein
MPSINDLNNAIKSVNDTLEKRSQERGEEMANKLLTNTANGRGLWVFLLWPTWMVIFAFWTSIIGFVMSRIGVYYPQFYINYVLSGFLCIIGYRSQFVRKHPLISSVLVVVGSVYAEGFLHKVLV